jgi:hypothetical protein
MLKKLLLILFITAATVALFDTVAYVVLPASWDHKLAGYRSNTMAIGGDRGLPRGYFVPHARRGFDIGKNRRASHYVDGLVYPVWSNSLGCFDNRPDIRGDYIYLAGDSFTWGFAPFADKFGTRLEKTLGMPVLKCGVNHSGQRHQLGKMQEIINSVGKSPRLIVVGYFCNDAANDYLFPHSSVIDGWYVDTAFLRQEKGGRFVRQEVPSATIRDYLRIRNAPPRRFSTAWFKQTAKRYFISLHIAGALRRAIERQFGEVDSGNVFFRSFRLPAKTGKAQTLHSVYRVAYEQEKNGHYDYRSTPYAAANKQALKGIKRYADRLGARLLVMLIPPKNHFNDEKYYDELRVFLGSNAVDMLDLTLPFKAGGYSAAELYWNWDQHFNIAGNRIVGTILADTVRHRYGISLAGTGSRVKTPAGITSRDSAPGN